ncbi:MAG: polysaccharide deacetylase family protein [Flavobacteriales bacterium]|nr:polysaccharide deacetylase family protein [Flavobacteriales bacterium]
MATEKPRVHVYIEKPAPRAVYAVRELLGGVLGLEVVQHTDPASCATADGAKLSYGEAEVPGAFRVTPAGLLQEEGVRPLEPKVTVHHGLPTMFPVEGGALPFDPFAAAFYMWTRYEEVAGMESDSHGRPVTTGLHAARHGHLERPVVDEWAARLVEAWRAADPGLLLVKRRYTQTCTIDLDRGFKYLGRPWWRQVAGLLRDAGSGDRRAVAERIRVLAGRMRDPYDVYAELARVLPRHAQRTIFFALSAPPGPMDHAVPVRNKHYRQRLIGLSNWAEVGVHPGYDSSEIVEHIGRDIQALAAAIGLPVHVGRQHFLRMRIPFTYRELEKAGIREDHSMGLHDRIGFRAGTCTPYRWYDLQQECATELMVHPFAVMDDALHRKMGLAPDAAVDQVRHVVDRVRAVSGSFVGLYHEAYLGDDPTLAGWRAAIHRIIEEARP